MLRVGLTGGVGSGKTAVAAVWRAEGVPVLEADAQGRALMQPGEAVYAAIVAAFGPAVVCADGQLDRAALAHEAFENGRLAELNGIVHPAVIAAQQAEFARLALESRHPLAVVESALIFEASGDGLNPASVPGWRDRFDRLVLVAAPEALRLQRFVARVAPPDATASALESLRADARRRAAAQLPESWKRERSDYVIENDRTLVLLRREALRILTALRQDAEGSAGS